MMTRTNPMRVPSPTATVEKPAPIVVQAAPSNLPAIAGTVVHTDTSGGEMKHYAPPQTTAGVAKIAEAISSVMGEIGVVVKDGVNKFHNYKYSKMEDILQRLTPLLAKNGLAIFQTELDRAMFDNDNAIAIRYAFTIAHKSGEVWPDRPVQTGVSRCRNSKDGFDDKCINKANTAARKYFLLALFQIPTGDEGDDTDAGPYDRQQPAQRPVPSPTGTAAKAMAARDQTAPSGPHTLSTEGMSIQAWAPKFIACVVNAKSVAELTEWDNLNSQALDLVDEKAPLLYDTICKAFQKRQAELASGATEKPGEVPSAAPVSDKGGTPSAQPAPAAAKNGGIPDAATQPEEFLKWADGQLASVIDPHSLEVMYNDYVEPQAQALLPPDKEELLGLFRKHERRLEP